MEVTLRTLATLDEALCLAPDLDVYIRESLGDLRDTPAPERAGERLLRRVFGSPEGLILTAHAPGVEGRVGYCVTGPLLDPLAGDQVPMVLALWVEPDFRHRGLARAMMRRVLSELSERGLRGVTARTGHNDDALISMGERWGFVRSFEVMVWEE